MEKITGLDFKIKEMAGRIKELREIEGLSIAEMAQKTDVSESEYLACKAASPVWEFLGKPGLPQVGYPDNYDTSCIGTHLGYVRRSEGHGISAYDWHWMLNFADQAFRQ